MSALEADFYDADLDNPDSRALLPLEDSPWLPLYREAAGWIEHHQPVFDLGCGTGRFAAQLDDRAHDGGYWGVDFSGRAIAAAQALELGWLTHFQQADLREWEPPEVLIGSTVFTCLETLEHLDDDRGLVGRIPPGHRFIFSVPNYGSAGHVRRFKTPAALWIRYGDLLVFRRWSYIDFAQGAPGRAIHLAETVRRSESWL